MNRCKKKFSAAQVFRLRVGKKYPHISTSLSSRTHLSLTLILQQNIQINCSKVNKKKPRERFTFTGLLSSFLVKRITMRARAVSP